MTGGVVASTLGHKRKGVFVPRIEPLGLEGVRVGPQLRVVVGAVEVEHDEAFLGEVVTGPIEGTADAAAVAGKNG